MTTPATTATAPAHPANSSQRRDELVSIRVDVNSNTMVRTYTLEVRNLTPRLAADNLTITRLLMLYPQLETVANNKFLCPSPLPLVTYHVKAGKYVIDDVTRTIDHTPIIAELKAYAEPHYSGNGRVRNEVEQVVIRTHVLRKDVPDIKAAKAAIDVLKERYPMLAQQPPLNQEPARERITSPFGGPLKRQQDGELDKFLPRDENGQPVDDAALATLAAGMPDLDDGPDLNGSVSPDTDAAPQVEKTSSITGTKAAAFHAKAGEILARYGVAKEDYDRIIHIAVMGAVNTSLKDWPGTFDGAIAELRDRLIDQYPESEAAANEFKMALVNQGGKLSNFKAATGYANRKDGYAAGLAPSDLLNLIHQWHPSATGLAANKPVDAPQTAAPSNDTAPAPIAASSPVVEASAGNDVAAPDHRPDAPASPTLTALPSIRTLGGISIQDIGKALDARLPPEAYSAIKHGQMTGKTDLDGKYVRDRLDQVFGGPGGWRIAPHPTAGRVELTTEERTGKNGPQTWFICRLVAHTFSYCAVMSNGSTQWLESSTTTDQHDNVDEQYSQRGAMTSLMKQFYGLLGGMNHIYYNEYTHVHAQRDIARRNQPQSQRKAS